ncbi:MAG: hypothetical protein J5771_02660 [Bacteroidales bacterium]|nr:hypothetical protein [Bacteroidales bacterium]
MGIKQIITDFSGVYSDEGWSPSRKAVTLDFKGMEGTSRYLDASARAELEKALSPLPCHALHWIDTGDYHYMSALWLQKLESPAQLVLFDNHPDDQAPAFGSEVLSCGSWMLEARANPMVRDDAPEVYLSIDLDVLCRDDARTNWDQGQMRLHELLRRIDEALEGKCLAGVDICGGLTIAQGASAEDLAVNSRTRQALEQYLIDRF